MPNVSQLVDFDDRPQGNLFNNQKNIMTASFGDAAHGSRGLGPGIGSAGTMWFAIFISSCRDPCSLPKVGYYDFAFGLSVHVARMACWIYSSFRPYYQIRQFSAVPFFEK